jgi:hypothetical protein
LAGLRYDTAFPTGLWKVEPCNSIAEASWA